MTASTTEELPKQYDHQAAQDRWYPVWEQRGYFHSEPDGKRQPFTIVIPPPNVTGALHLGHALNNTLQDVLIRMKRMQGFNALWMPGTDHAGIATQAVVERRLLEEEKLSRHDLGREKLVDRIWEWKQEYENVETMTLAVMGCIVNGPGESRAANIGISLPGTGESPSCPVYIDGEHFTTLRGSYDELAAAFQALVDDYVATKYAKRHAVPTSIPR